MDKTYESVEAMARDLCGEGFADKLGDQVHRKSLATTLMALRCRAGLTQTQMAEKLGVAQGKISKIEHADIDKISVGDLLAYAEATGFNIDIGFHQRRTSVDHVKFHAVQMKDHLEALAKLAHKDPKINQGVTEFFQEATVNILAILSRGFKLLPKSKPVARTSPLSIQAQMEEKDAEENLVIA